MEYKYEDGLKPGGRRPRLWLAKGAEVVKFSGKSIPGFCQIAKEIYEPAGKWSRTFYTLLLAPSVVPLYFLSPLHGVWGEDLDSWDEVADTLNLPVEVCMEIVKAEYPDTAKRLDEIEAFADASDTDVEIVSCFVRTPSRRRNTPQYWAEEKEFFGRDGTRIILRSADGTQDGWDNPVLVEPSDAQIVRVEYLGGYKPCRKIDVILPSS
jgi:hypothetical protein